MARNGFKTAQYVFLTLVPCTIAVGYDGIGIAIIRRSKLSFFFAIVKFLVIALIRPSFSTCNLGVFDRSTNLVAVCLKMELDTSNDSDLVLYVKFGIVMTKLGQDFVFGKVIFKRF
ncbi:hypothetical protein L596_015927 [Steinernema carpocapsae]|uniref:Uncharacterized protein n=1 Tax=Steinernema carpocapsae TaxID=34508 RepID=A0A4U5NGF2_STECR|nr:hypothetical protein L596_015927 [Steinernema carpocapsae]